MRIEGPPVKSLIVRMLPRIGTVRTANALNLIRAETPIRALPDAEFEGLES